MYRILSLTLAVSAFFFATNVNAKEVAFGDLYNIEWCPCNSEEPFDANGSVVLGKTVMCPCESQFSGYKKGLEQDLKEIKRSAVNQLRKFNYFKYYLGLDYVMGKTSAGSTEQVFDDKLFASGPIKIMPADVIDDQDSLSFVAGIRFSKHWGMEAFYQQSYEDNYASQIDTNTLNHPDYHLLNDFTTSFKAYGADLIGYIPFSPYFDLVASLGLAQYKFENDAVFTSYFIDGTDKRDVAFKNFDESKIGWRAAIGAQLNIANGVALRMMYRYIHIGGDVIDKMDELSIGLRFLF